MHTRRRSLRLQPGQPQPRLQRHRGCIHRRLNVRDDGGAHDSDGTANTRRELALTTSIDILRRFVRRRRRTSSQAAASNVGECRRRCWQEAKLQLPSSLPYGQEQLPPRRNRASRFADCDLLRHVAARTCSAGARVSQAQTCRTARRSRAYAPLQQTSSRDGKRQDGAGARPNAAPSRHGSQGDSPASWRWMRAFAQRIIEQRSRSDVDRGIRQRAPGHHLVGPGPVTRARGCCADENTTEIVTSTPRSLVDAVRAAAFIPSATLHGDRRCSRDEQT